MGEGLGFLAGLLTFFILWSISKIGERHTYDEIYQQGYEDALKKIIEKLESDGEEDE